MGKGSSRSKLEEQAMWGIDQPLYKEGWIVFKNTAKFFG